MVDIFYPLELFARYITFTLFKLNEGNLAESLIFFISDTLKIFILLFFMIAIIGYLRTYIDEAKLQRWLSKKNHILSHFGASIFGAITPFCSCSSIPLFISFLEARIPLGVAFSFLITSPLINEYVVVVMFGFFGWKITLAYILSGIIIGVIAGMILGSMGLDKELVADLISKKVKIKKTNAKKVFKDRVRFGLDEAISIVKKMWHWIIIGVGIGALLHGFIPKEFIEGMISKTGIFTIPLVVLLGVPLYANCAAILPIAIALLDKGIPLGTALAFMMATAALSFPEAIMLRRAMKLRLILIFFGITALAIIFTGYLFNILQKFLI